MSQKKDIKNWLSWITLERECQSQKDGGPNKKFGYKPRVGLIKCSLKNCKMAAYSQVSQTIAPIPDYCSMRHQCIVGGAPSGCGLAAVCRLVLIRNRYQPRSHIKTICGPDVGRRL